MAGLEEVGIPGRDFLREALTNCSDPLRAIEEFQEENGILLPSLRTMLPLLDLHGVPRLEFHLSIQEELKDRLLKQIEELGKMEGEEKDRKLGELLEKSFPVVKVPSLRPVVMCILKNMDHVDDKYLKRLVADKTLYDDCDVSVRRQIWLEQQKLFGEEVYPLFFEYIKEKENILWNIQDATPSFFYPTPKQRRQSPVVQKLVTMIGRNVVLYDMVLQLLRSLFIRSKSVHYCTLRAELLMALHDAEIQDITAVDPCYKFTWCLDACIREKNIDVKRSRELQGFLDGIRKGQEQVLGDLSMVLCDPFAMNFLATAAMKVINHCINNEALPRDNQVLILELRMMAIGLESLHMLRTQDYREPKLDPQVITKFVPAMMSLLVDDQVRNLTSKLPQSDRESAITTIEHSGPPPDAYQAYIQENGVACILALYYTLHVARHKDKTGLMRVLGTLSTSEGARAFDDTFLHSLVGHLVGMTEDFSAEDLCTVIFDEFLLTSLIRDHVVRHLIKLIWHTHHKLTASRLEGLLKALQTVCAGEEKLLPLLEQLKEKIKNHSSTSTETTKTDSPFLSVSIPSNQAS